MRRNLINVGIAAYGICRAPYKIETVGLGSCVGVVLYSILDDVCCMAHVMLPENVYHKSDKPAKYADTAIDTMIEELQKIGIRKEFLKAKISGGASMFETKYASINQPIGVRNVESVKKQLAKYRIDITGEDVGGNISRTVVFDPYTRILEVRMPGNTINKI